MNKFSLITLSFALLLVNNCVNADGFSIIGNAQPKNDNVNNKQNLNIVRKSSFDNIEFDNNVINKNMVGIDARTNNNFGAQASNRANFVVSNNNNFVFSSNVQQASTSKAKVDLMKKQENNNNFYCETSTETGFNNLEIDSNIHKDNIHYTDNKVEKSTHSNFVKESVSNNNFFCEASPKKKFNNLQIDTQIHSGNTHEINACANNNTPKAQQENFQGLITEIINIISNDRKDYLKTYGCFIKKVDNKVQIINKRDNKVVRTINIKEKNKILKKIISNMNESGKLQGNPLQIHILSVIMDNMIYMDNWYRADKLLKNILERACKEDVKNKDSYLKLSEQLMNIFKEYKERVNDDKFSTEEQSELNITNDDKKIKENIKALNNEQKELFYGNMLGYTIEEANDLKLGDFKIGKQSLKEFCSDDKTSKDDKIFALCEYNRGKKGFLSNFIGFGNVWAFDNIVMKIFCNSKTIVQYPMVNYFGIPMFHTFSFYNMFPQFNFVF